MNPGSKEAIDAGCTCPRVDNCHGEGYRGQPNVFLVAHDYPIHYPPDEPRRFHGDATELAA